MDIDAILLAAKGPKGDDGDPTLSADLTSTDPGKGAELVSRGSVAVASFADIADVPASVGARGISINLRAYHSGNNKGGGVFTWDATSTDSDDGGTIVTPSGHSGPGRWVRQLDGYVTPEMFGAKGDGVTDDTTSIVNSTSTYPTICDTDAVYMVTTVDLPAGASLDLNGSKLKLLPSQPTYTPVLSIANDDIKIINGTIDGNLAENLTPAGPGGQDGGMHGIRIYSADNINLTDLTITECRTDGIYIGVQTIGDRTPSNITCTNVVSNNNYRQGLSVITADTCLFDNCDFSNTDGTLPEAGVDLEPNSATQDFRDITFRKCRMTGNSGRGFTVFMRGGKCTNLTLDDCLIGGNTVDLSNGQLHFTGSDASEYHNLLINNCDVRGLTVFGASSSHSTYFDARFTGGGITESTLRSAVRIIDTSDGSRITFEDTRVLCSGDNPSTGGAIGINTSKGLVTLERSSVSATGATNPGVYVSGSPDIEIIANRSTISGTSRGVHISNGLASGEFVDCDMTGPVDGVLASSPSVPSTVIIRRGIIHDCDTGVRRSGAAAQVGTEYVEFVNNTTNTVNLNSLSKFEVSETPSITAPVGSIATNTTGGRGVTLWYKASGSGASGWAPVAEIITLPKFSDIATIPASTGLQGVSINLASYYDGLNKGGGQFFWDSTSTDADDGGSIVTPSGHSGPGRWVRRLDGYVTPEMFGEDGIVDSGSTLPGYNNMILDYSTPSNITGADTTLISGTVVIVSLGGNETLIHDSSPSPGDGAFVLSGGVNLALTPYTPIQFMIIDGNLYQI